MKTILVGFGDSWTFGSELDRPEEQSWVAQLATKMSVDYINLGTPASSTGHLIVQLFDFIQRPEYTNYKKVFMIGLTGSSRYLSYSNEFNEFVNITPEATYRTSNIHKSGAPPDTAQNLSIFSSEMYKQVECDKYNKFLLTQTMFTFQQYCLQNNIDYLFFRYFDTLAPLAIVDQTKLYPDTITYALTGAEYQLPDVRNNQYFAGKLFHPNISGHTQIAELLYKHYVSSTN